MAGTSLLALIDDIASLLDDVATMTKVATKKTAGVLGDDLALNAEQTSGVDASRELPVVFAVAKGSAINKAILVPVALAISALAPWAITPLLMIGGSYLCFEGFEKVAHALLHRHDPKEDARHSKLASATANPEVDMVAFEKKKVRGAIRTDFILSAEIIVIALGAVAEATLVQQIAVLVAIAALMTVGVYGLVGVIVKLDDVGLVLIRRKNGVAKLIGRGLLRGTPYMMKTLSVAGTIAMFLVGGGILTHGIPPLHHLTEHVGAVPGVVGVVAPTLIDGLTGVLVGALIVALVTRIKRLLPKRAQPADATPRPDPKR